MTVTNSQTPKLNSAARSSVRSDRVLGATMIIAGLAIAVVSYSQTGNAQHVMAQAAPPSAPANASPPRDPTEGQSRPTTPAPEPARPQPMPDATPNSPGTTGSSTTTPPAALPPAPAEKVGDPIKPR